MPIKEPFKTTSPQLVNYDFTDILSDVGYVTLYAMKDLANNTTLVRQAIESDEVEVRYTVGSSGLQGEVNFDYTFRQPTRLDGLCYVTITYFATATGVQTANGQVKARLIHVDTGASETEIAAQQESVSIEETQDTSTQYNSVTFSFDIDQAFAKNEKFRLEVEGYGSNTTNAEMGYFIDPANRDFGQNGLNGLYETTITPSTQLKVLVPFPLEE